MARSLTEFQIELRIRMEDCMLEAMAILHEEGGDLFTILNNRFNIDRGMVERWAIKRRAYNG